METPMRSLITHLEMLGSRVEMVNVQSIIDTINESYLHEEKEHLKEAWENGDHCIDLPDGGWEQKYKSGEDYFNKKYKQTENESIH